MYKYNIAKHFDEKKKKKTLKKPIQKMTDRRD